MSTYTSDFDLADIVDNDDEVGAKLDVASSYIDNRVRITIFTQDGDDPAIFLTPAQARRVAASITTNADRADMYRKD